MCHRDCVHIDFGKVRESYSSRYNTIGRNCQITQTKFLLTSHRSTGSMIIDRISVPSAGVKYMKNAQIVQWLQQSHFSQILRGPILQDIIPEIARTNHILSFYVTRAFTCCSAMASYFLTWFNSSSASHLHLPIPVTISFCKLLRFASTSSKKLSSSLHQLLGCFGKYVECSVRMICTFFPSALSFWVAWARLSNGVIE